MREECVIVIVVSNALLLMELSVRVRLGEPVTDAVCVNVLTIFLVQLVSAVTLGVIAVVKENVLAA